MEKTDIEEASDGRIVLWDKSFGGLGLGKAHAMDGDAFLYTFNYPSVAREDMYV